MLPTDSFFYPLLIASLFIDTGALIVLHVPLLQTTLCFFSCAWIYHTMSPLRLTLLAITVAFLWFSVWNNALVAAGYVTMLTMIARAIHTRFYPNRIQTVLIVALGIMGQWITQVYFLGYATSLVYTKKVLFVNIIIVILYSLIYVRGRQGNRFQVNPGRGKSGLLTN